MPSTNETNRKAYFIEIMKRRILSGELKPGDRIPPERELAAELGISRGSVNQGMLDLARMGFLRIVPRKGAFVAEYVKSATPETLASIMSYDSALLDRSLFKALEHHGIRRISRYFRQALMIEVHGLRRFLVVGGINGIGVRLQKCKRFRR